MGKIPVNIITGFLGAGKTTAIINLLRQKTSDDQWAVIINEFGKISIDTQTLRSSNVKGEVFDISGGCICCSAKGYFHENLTEIIKSGIYNRIIIEPSGLGGIEMVSEIVESIADLVLMPKICLVDIQLIDNARLQKLPIYRIQIIKSDIIIFTKCDLLPYKLRETELKNKFEELYPGKVIHEYPYIYTLLDDCHAGNSEKARFRLASFDNNNLDDSNYQKKIFIFDSSIVFDAEKLAQILGKHSEILRAKGHICVRNNWLLINYTLSQFDFELCDQKVQNEIVIITENANAAFFDELEQEIILAIIK